jgi:phage-related minor tail protein
VITRLDERAAQAASDQIEREFGDAGKRGSTALNREMESGFRGLTGMVREFGRGLRDGIDGELANVGTSFDAVSDRIGGIGKASIGAVAGVAAIGTAAVVVGKQLYDLGAEWDSIADGMTIRTGKVGDDLKNLTNVVGDVSKTTAASMGSIGEIVGQLSQSMPELAQNSGAIREMASNLAYLGANGEQVNIRELGKAFDAFGVNAADQVEMLSRLKDVSQATGIPINNLIQTVQQGAPQFKQFGLNMGESTGLMAAFEDGGLNAQGALSGLRIALSNLGNDARGPQKALADTIEQIKQLSDTGQKGAASDLAKKIFGSESFAPFLDAIESGRVNVEGLKKAIDDTGLSITNMQKLTNDGAQGWQALSNTIKTDLKPAADGIFGALNAGAQLLTHHFSDVVDSLAGVNSKLADASDKLKDMAAVPITPDSALGKMLLPAGGLPGMPGVVAPNSAGATLGMTTLQPYSWGTKPIAPPAASRGSGPKLPDAPVLPYDTTLPAGFAGLPQTAELVGAENSWMDARHTLAEKQARVNQLEHDNNATAADVQKAKNDQINAQQALDQSLLRLYDTQNKRLQQHASDMQDIGAKLDSDFGISKGLAGIAENLFKFLANLAAAPLEGQLNAIANAPGQAQGGYGLMGVLGAQGAFGPQYTAAGQAAAANGGASALGPAVLQPGGGVTYSSAGGAYPGDAALLANVPAGRYTQTQGADLTQGLADCSSAVEDLVNLMDGRPTAGRSMSTGNEAEWLTQHGFQPGMGGPGDFRVGFNSGHTQATLPGGTPFNWGSDAAAANRGIGGTGADDPAFTSHYYRPVGGAPGPAAPASGGAPVTVAVPSGGGGPSFPVPLPVTIVGGLPGGGGIPGLAPGIGAPPTSSGAPGSPYAPTPGGGGGGAPDLYGPANTSPGLNNPASPGGIVGPGGYQPSPMVGGPMPGAMGGALGGPGANTTRIGGATAGLEGQGGGIGVSGGLMDAAMMGAGALDMMAPGMGQVAQTGMKLANRAIQFGSQAVGIGVQGAIDTFIPFGGSKLASSNWFTKIIGGIAGSHPTLPNVAGKGTQPTPQSVANVDPNAQPGQGQGGQPAGGNTYNANITNNQPRDEGGSGRDALHIWQNQGPGM